MSTLCTFIGACLEESDCLFEDAGARTCGLTGARDPVVVSSYRTRNYGTNYSEGFKHPLTPYYRQKRTAVTWLAVHPNPGGLSYRLWPGLVISSKDKLREPAQVIRIWQQERAASARESRFVAFGYDMESWKARAWIEGEMPLVDMDDVTREWLVEFIRRATGGANTVAGLVTRSVKSALYDRLGNASGDFGFIAERFYRETEDTFLVHAGRRGVCDPERPRQRRPDHGSSQALGAGDGAGRTAAV